MCLGTELDVELLSGLYIEGWSMHFQKPVVLLLGGLLTASGIGCSAASALFTDMRPAPVVHKSSSERMLAIGRMFEEQGRLDRAEAMYRGAVRKNPRDQAARESLANVQSRRRAPQTGGSLVAAQPATKQTPVRPVSTTSPAPQAKVNAAAKPPAAAQQAAPKSQSPKPAAPVEKPPQAPPAQQQQQPAIPPSLPGVPAAASGPNSASGQPSKPAAASAAATVAAPVPTPASAPVSAPSPAPATTPAPAQTPASVATSNPPSPPATVVSEPTFPALDVPVALSSESDAVTLDHVLAAVEAPAEQKTLLIRGLHSGDTPEAQCLAAALLGECGAADAEVTAALEEAGTKSDDPCLVLAVLDSQLNRGKPHINTASNLLRLLPISDAETQIQGITSLRHFSGTESRGECVKYLSGLLESGNSELRAAAVLALGDMGPLPAETIERLEKLSKEDECEAVRESAAATLARPLK